MAFEKFEHNDLLQMIMLETRLLMCKMDHKKISTLLVEQESVFKKWKAPEIYLETLIQIIFLVLESTQLTEPESVQIYSQILKQLNDNNESLRKCESYYIEELKNQAFDVFRLATSIRKWTFYLNFCLKL